MATQSVPMVQKVHSSSSNPSDQRCKKRTPGFGSITPSPRTTPSFPIWSPDYSSCGRRRISKMHTIPKQRSRIWGNHRPRKADNIRVIASVFRFYFCCVFYSCKFQSRNRFPRQKLLVPASEILENIHMYILIVVSCIIKSPVTWVNRNLCRVLLKSTKTLCILCYAYFFT